jgi:hypothetical protein
MRRRPFSLIAIAFALTLAALAPASPVTGEVKPFDLAAFAAAQNAGASVVVTVHAPW